MVHLHNVILQYLAVKKKKMLLFAEALMDLEIIMLSENKPVRERKVPYDFTHVESNEQNKQGK